MATSSLLLLLFLFNGKMRHINQHWLPTESNLDKHRRLLNCDVVFQGLMVLILLEEEMLPLNLDRTWPRCKSEDATTVGGALVRGDFVLTAAHCEIPM